MMHIPEASLLFGTAQLGLRQGARAQVRLLTAAAAAGFEGFDTAPSYGDGRAERLIGKVLKEDPGLQVQTKVGLQRRLRLRRLPRPLGVPLVAAATRLGLDTALPVTTVDGVRRQHEASLRRLGVDHVDALLLHEPDTSTVTDEVLAWLLAQRERSARLVGLAGPWAAARPLVDRGGIRFDVLQVPAADLEEVAAASSTRGCLIRGYGLVRWAGPGDRVEQRVVVGLARVAQQSGRPVSGVVASMTEAHIDAWGSALASAS